MRPRTSNLVLGTSKSSAMRNGVLELERDAIEVSETVVLLPLLLVFEPLLGLDEGPGETLRQPKPCFDDVAGRGVAVAFLVLLLSRLRLSLEQPLQNLL